jgi:heptosyltransferase III
MKTVALGDTILLSGIVKDLHTALPGVTVVLITGEDNRELAPMILEAGDEHVVISPFRLVGSISALRAAKLDVLVDFGAWVRFDAALSALSGARWRVGFKTAGHARHFAYDATVEYSGVVHEVDNNRRLVALMGVKSASLPQIRASGQSKSPKPFAVLHAWPGGFKSHVREWPEERWVELATRLASRGWSIVLTGGPGDRERSAALASRMTQRGVEVLDRAGQWRIAELANELAASEVTVSVNTGVMHLAAAVGARTVGLQGPTSSVRWGPIGLRTRAVDSVFPGCGYLNLGSEYHGQRLDCMNGISIDSVIGAVDDLLALRP